jgi:hypothetical protein
MQKNPHAVALGRKGGSVSSERKTAAVRENARRPRPAARKHVYAAIAQYSGKDAGHVCYGLTRDEAREKARARTTMTVVVRREAITPELLERLRQVGKI